MVTNTPPNSEGLCYLEALVPHYDLPIQDYKVGEKTPI